AAVIARVDLERRDVRERGLDPALRRDRLLPRDQELLRRPRDRVGSHRVGRRPRGQWERAAAGVLALLSVSIASAATVELGSRSVLSSKLTCSCPPATERRSATRSAEVMSLV